MLTLKRLAVFLDATVGERERVDALRLEELTQYLI